jgi:MarC family membrane protein
MYSPASVAINTLHSNYVRFSVLAVSSIFFLVDPFAAIPAFLAITAGSDQKRQKRMARKGALTCLIVLTTFALAGKLIFRMFGITLPAFEIAGGVILLLIGIDMIEARRSPTQESSDETAEATSKEDAGIVPLGIPMLASDPQANAGCPILRAFLRRVVMIELSPRDRAFPPPTSVFNTSPPCTPSLGLLLSQRSLKPTKTSQPASCTIRRIVVVLESCSKQWSR